MATRKDLLKAQSFTTQRLVAALVDRNPDEVASPLKRSVTGIFASLMAGIMVLAGIMLWAKMHPGTSNAWRQEGVIIEDTTSGTLFTYQANDDTLTPLSDITSARLFAAASGSTDAPRIITVKGPSLAGVKHATMRGITGAPRQLPTPELLDAYPIKVCATAPNAGGQRFVTMQFNAPPPTRTTQSGVAVGVQDSAGNQFIVADGVAHRLPKVLGGGRLSPVLTGYPLVLGAETWLKALPSGSPLTPIDVPNTASKPQNPGDPSLRVGQVAQVGTGPSAQYYLQFSEGLRRISYLEAQTLRVLKTNTDPVQITDTAATAASDPNHPRGGASDLSYDKPLAPSSNIEMSTTSLCATWNNADSPAPVVSVGDATPDIPRSQDQPQGAVADVIEMPPLHGALLQSASTLNGPATPTTLVVDSRAYNIPDQESRFALGYPANKTHLTRVPVGLIQLIPSGLPVGVNLSKGFVLPV